MPNLYQRIKGYSAVVSRYKISDAAGMFFQLWFSVAHRQVRNKIKETKRKKHLLLFHQLFLFLCFGKDLPILHLSPDTIYWQWVKCLQFWAVDRNAHVMIKIFDIQTTS